MNLTNVKEGDTDLMVPDPASYTFQGRYEPSLAPVFYNPKMEFSRDIAVLVLNVFAVTRKRYLEICDPLAGLGARGIRFAKEVKNVNQVVVGDLNDDAIPIILENIHLNGVERLVNLNHKDACLLLTEHAEPGKRFDYIDVDPFGTPSPFLDSAVRALKNGGIMAITATDTAPLCGIYSHACYRKYGGSSIRSEFCHEVGLRLMIGTAVRETLKYDMAMDVLLSYSADHYLRAYLKGSLGAKRGDVSASHMGYIFYCPACGWRESYTQASEWPCGCKLCGKKLMRAGPLWCGSLCDKPFIEKMLGEDRSHLNTNRRIEKLFSNLISECDKPPGYYVIDNIASRLGRDVPSLKNVIEGLSAKGYESCVTHFHPKAVKTFAPLPILEEVVGGMEASPIRSQH
jgi:tRNA (guanine26-N2/guanine27-N2)-dimethyltransferase